jgi:hypothetical protein
MLRMRSAPGTNVVGAARASERDAMGIRLIGDEDPAASAGILQVASSVR